VLLIDGTHQGCGRWQNLIDEDEDSLLWGKLDPLADDIDELSDRKVCWDQVLLFIDGCDIRLLYLLTDNLDTTSSVRLAYKGEKQRDIGSRYR